MPGIRPVTPADIPQLVVLGAALAAESPFYSALTYDADKTAAFIAEAADTTVTHITGWVSEEDGAVIAFIMAYTSEHPFFSDTYAWDGTMYVAPEYRGKCRTTVSALVATYVEWASQWGGPIMFGVTTGINADGVEGLLQRHGFETVGRSMQYVRR